MFLGCHFVTCSFVLAHVMSTCDVDSLNVHFTFQVWWEGGKNPFCVSDAILAQVWWEGGKNPFCVSDAGKSAGG